MKKSGIIALIALIVIFAVLFFFINIFKSCPSSCDDFNECTEDFCSEETDFKCVHKPIDNCCGNGKCELSGDYKETYENCPDDCPNCDDSNKCTKDSYDYHLKKCINKDITPCCGNQKCEAGESHTSCEIDCPLEGYIKIGTSYIYNPEKFSGTGARYFYIIENCLDKDITILELTNYDNGKVGKRITKEWLESFPEGEEEYEFITISKDTCTEAHTFIAEAQEQKDPNTQYKTKIYFKFKYGDKIIEFTSEEKQATTDDDELFIESDLAVFTIDNSNVKSYK